MAATLIDLSGFIWAFSADETGINVKKIDTKINSKKLDVPDRQGEDRGYVDYNPYQEDTVEGEITGGTGVAAARLATALTLANAITDDHGAGTTGGIYVMDIAISQGREELRSITVNTKRRPGVA